MQICWFRLGSFARQRTRTHIYIYCAALMYNWWCIFFTCSFLCVYTLRPFLTFLLTKLRMKNPIKMNPSRINTFVFFIFICRVAAAVAVAACCHLIWLDFLFRSRSFTCCSHTPKNFQHFSPSISYLNRMYARGSNINSFLSHLFALPFDRFSHGLLFMHFHMQ